MSLTGARCLISASFFGSRWASRTKVSCSRPPAGGDGLYWNSNFGPNYIDNTGHDSVVNYLPWETPPTPYSVGINGSQDYPDIAPGNVATNAVSVLYAPGATSSGGDLTSNNITLPPGIPHGTGGTAAAIRARTVTGDPVQIRINVPHFQPANQQLYQQAPGQAYNGIPYTGSPTGGQVYDTTGQIPPVNEAGASQITQVLCGSNGLCHQQAAVCAVGDRLLQ